MKTFAPAFAALLFISTVSPAQKTWNDVYTILNSSCGSIVGGCHESGSSNPSFNVEASPSVLYAQLINGTPTNPYAKDSAGNKLVVPGSPQTSFLMRKLAHCGISGRPENNLSLTQPFEGATMPEGGSRLPEDELELIFNWILQGASDVAAIEPESVAGDICDLNVGVKTLPANELSFNAYPNPASGSFSCSYSLQQPSMVMLELLDVAGKKVRELLNEKQNAGVHVKTIIPDAEAGVYFIRLTVNGAATSVRKITLH